jgi:Fe-S oxidoreductase
MNEKIIKRLEDIVGAEFVSTRADALLTYSHKASMAVKPVIPAVVVVRPANATEVSQILQTANKYKIPVTPRSGGSSLQGEDYPKLGMELPEVLHLTEALQEIIKGKKLKLNLLDKGAKVTYHDPCHLARATGVYDDPREIIKAIPGVELVEMETNREAAMCCGAGGGLRSYDAELSKKMAADRVKSAEDIDAKIIATACPFCEHNLIAGAELINSSIRVVDVVDLLAESLKRKREMGRRHK